jgi:sulfonate transport system substrate-binding protein
MGVNQLVGCAAQIRPRGRTHRAVGAAVAVAVLFASAACSSSAGSKGGGSSADKSLTVAVPPAVLQTAIMALAKDKGYFKAQGLNVNFAYVVGGPAIVSAVMSGSAQIGDTVPLVAWPLMKKGEHVVALLANEAQTYNVIAQEGLAGISEPQPGEAAAKANLLALKGKTIGVSGRGSANEAVARGLLSRAGLNPDKDVTFVAVGNSTTGVPAFQKKQVDALVTFPPEEELLTAAGTPFKHVAQISGTGIFKNLLTDYWGATSSFVEKNRAEATGFCTAMTNSYKYAMNPANADAVAAYLQTYLKLPSLDFAQKLWARWNSTFTQSISQDRWSQQADYFTGTPTQGYVPAYGSSVDATCQGLVQ